MASTSSDLLDWGSDRRAALGELQSRIDHIDAEFASRKRVRIFKKEPYKI
jgi:hypothetical protein